MRYDYAKRKIKLAEEFGIRRTASISWTSLFGTILHGASARRLTTARSKSKRTNGTSSVLLSRSALPLGSAFGLHHSVAILTAMILVVVNIVLMYPRSALRPLPVAASRSMWLFPTFLLTALFAPPVFTAARSTTTSVLMTLRLALAMFWRSI